MDSDRLGFWQRFWLAFLIPWKILFDSRFATRIRQAARQEAIPAGPSTNDASTALQILGILQREGRFIDFLQEDVSGYADQQIGAAARVVHEGCRRVLRESFVLAPVRNESEGAKVVLDSGFDPARVRVTGDVVGQPPFSGRLTHHGWQVTEIRLPTLTDGHDVTVVAPAEIELRKELQ